MTPTTQAESLPEKTAPVSRSRIISNTVYSVAGYVVYLPVNLLVSRFVVHRLGDRSFGIWAALTTIMAFGGLLDLGVTTPLIRYVAEYRALGRERDTNTLLSTALVFYLGVALVFVAGLAAASAWVMVHLFHANAGDRSLLELYFAVAGGFGLWLVFSPLQSLITGLQRADLMARINLFFNLASAAGTVLLVGLGLGVQGLAISWFTVNVLTVIVNGIVAKRLFPPLTLNPLNFSWATLKMILRFSSKVQVTTITLFLNDQVDRGLIAYALGPTQLAFYQLAGRASYACAGISTTFMSAILAATSDLSALQETARLQHLYLRVSRYLMCLDLGICVGLAALARPLIWAWLGPGFDRVAVTMAIIMIGYAFWLPSQATAEPLNGIGRPEIRMRADIGFLLLHVPLCVFLIWRFGYYGTVAGTAFALSSTRLYIYIRGPRELGVRPIDLARQAIVQPVAAAVLAASAAVALQVWVPALSWTMLACEAALFGVVYAAYSLRFVLDAYDRQLLVRQLGALRALVTR